MKTKDQNVGTLILKWNAYSLYKVLKTCRTCKQDFPLTFYRLGGSGMPRPDCNACDTKKIGTSYKQSPVITAVLQLLGQCAASP